MIVFSIIDTFPPAFETFTDCDYVSQSQFINLSNDCLTLSDHSSELRSINLYYALLGILFACIVHAKLFTENISQLSKYSVGI